MIRPSFLSAVPILLLLTFHGGQVAAAATKPPTTTTKINNNHKNNARPSLVTDALERKQDLYYFGVGSNMLKSKLEHRSVCGTKIQCQSFQPAIVRNARLAFHMRGFLPLEPGMGSLELLPPDDTTTTTTTSSKPLLAYDKPECHGALVQLSAEDYERVMRSEGVGGNTTRSGGYEEVVVQAYPYDNNTNSNNQQPVTAIALRARQPWPFDPAPSQRYMTILQQGAQELGIYDEYQTFLHHHPVATPPVLVRKLAVGNLIWTATLSFRYKLRWVSQVQSAVLWKVYVPPTAPWAKQLVSHLLTGMVLAPGAVVGLVLWQYWRITKKEMSPMMKLMVASHW